MRHLWIVAVIVMLAAEALAQTAEDLYAQGQEAYDRKSYGEAIERWKASYRMSNEGALFFNIAQAQRLSGDCRGAIESYRRYTQTDPDPASEQRKLADDFTLDLERTCPPPKPVVVTDVRPVEAGPQPAEPHAIATSGGKSLRLAGLVTGGASIAVIATGLYLGHRGQAIGDEVTGACRESCDWSVWKDKDARGQRYASIGTGMVIGGTIGVVGGIALYYLGVRQGSITVEPRTRDGGAAVFVTGSW